MSSPFTILFEFVMLIKTVVCQILVLFSVFLDKILVESSDWFYSSSYLSCAQQLYANLALFESSSDDVNTVLTNMFYVQNV